MRRKRAQALLALLVAAAGCQSAGSEVAGTVNAPGGAVAVDSASGGLLADECVGVECCPAGYAVVEGSPASEVLSGGNRSQCIVAYEGDDTVNGGNAPDRIDCGAGNDTCNGGRGDDVVLGGEGDDVLVGDNGVDLLRGGPGRDSMDGGRGDDIFVVANVCEAVPGERILGGQGFDTLRTALSLAQLVELGVEVDSIESIVPLDPSDGEPECEIPAPGSFGAIGGDPTERMCRVLAQTAAVVRGRVTGITPVFDERPGEGPRRIVELSEVETLLGLGQPNALRLRVVGGQLPDGDLIEASDVPRFQIGDDYVVFLFNRSWRFAPVPLDFYFRVREENGHEMLITETGHVLTGGLGGQLIRQSFAAVEADPAQGELNPISAQEMTRVASVTKYGTDLEAIADACPDGPSGVFTPFPAVPWDVMHAAQDLPTAF
jgi:RTX calcium-binding nonapeptide repeat (4 copies)